MIRRASVDDAPGLAHLHIAAWQHTYQRSMPREFLDSLDVERRITWFETRIGAGADILVAVADEMPVGFCFVGGSDEEGWGEVYAIYVHPDHLGAGHGYRLLVEAESTLLRRGYDRALLWVLEGNQRARRFYERQRWLLGQRLRLEDFGGTQLTEVRYEKQLRAGP